MGPRIIPVAIQDSGFGRIQQILRQNLFINSAPEFWIQKREHYFHALVKIARHPVSAGKVNLGLAAILEIVNPAVFKKPAYYAADPNPVAQSANSRSQRTPSPHNQVNLHSRPGGAIESFDDLLIQQCIDLGNDAGRMSASRVGGFPINQLDAIRGEINRSKK